VAGTTGFRDSTIRLKMKRVALVLPALLALGCATPTSSLAASASPHWSIVSESQPTNFKAGDPSDAYVLIVRNNGEEPTAHGSTVTVTDTLPVGVTATKIAAEGEGANGSGTPRSEMTCPTGPVTGALTCTYEEGPERGPVLPGATIVVTITVSIGAEAKALVNSATVSGGGAPSAATEETTPIDGAAIPFGLSYFRLDTVGERGEPDTQAASHPFELTTELAFNVSLRESPSAQNSQAESPLANAAPKDLEVALPPGLIGDPSAMPRCSQRAFLEQEALNCPIGAQVGTVKPFFYGRSQSSAIPVFNIAPPPGEPAELGFSMAGIGHVPLFFHVRGNIDDGLTVQLNDIPETGPLQGAILTLWGVPADASHDLEREGTLGEAGPQAKEHCEPSVKFVSGVEVQKGCPSDVPAKPFLTMPSSCGSRALPVPATGDSWQSAQSQPLPLLREAMLPAMTGCERLSFNPSLTLAPETTQADTPSGFTVALHIPQNEDPSALATPDLRNATVSLPAGIVLSPSVADGLQACAQDQFAAKSLAPSACPQQSQIGTAKISTPLLSSPLEGQIFLGEPECAPCTPSDAQHGRLLRLLVQAQGSGVMVKLEGSASINQSTGRLTASFEQLPQLPFEEVQLTFNGGPRAPLANASTCGVPLAASSWLTPYSSEWPARAASAPFALGGCPPPQLHPSFVAGTTDNRAGQPSALAVTLSRSDQDEDLENVSVHLPPGLLAILSKVQLCPEAQARAGACGPDSEVGTATVGAGPGADPLFLEGGRVYVTGPYEGAPFGLSIVVPVLAGPFNLGTIDVGARIEVNPITAALSIVSDPLPQSLDGIPLQLRTVNLNIDRASFMFNPTSCQPLAIEGSLGSSDGVAAAVSSRFQAADCAALVFKPKLSGLTHATASKAGGVHLHVRIVSASGQANIAAVKLDLPKRMVPRLSTLQQACTAAVFEASPASCPAASVVGTATVLTPVVREPLSGPVYVVSNGRAATPEIALVLHGEGMVLDVVGQTSVKGGVASAAFRSLPDAPISELDLLLEAGPHSLLAANLPANANGSMCGQSLAMPVELTGQNGAVLKQTPRIAVSGCPRRKARGKATHAAYGKPTRKA
jgi:uncharacterized repeat protein (TIGR01451 family)